jgi:hypothetical protein
MFSAFMMHAKIIIIPVKESRIKSPESRKQLIIYYKLEDIDFLIVNR